MRCIYFTGTVCEANPPVANLNYKPTDVEQKAMCNTDKFSSCPRIEAFLEYLKAMHKS